MIYLIGGEGFVGSAFARACTQQERDFRIITRANYAEYADSACDVVINANGNSRKLLAQKDPLGEFDASVRSVRASLIDFPCALYIYLSSCDVYPDCSVPTITLEEQLPDITKQSPYGFHKYLAEQCVRQAASEWMIFRLGGMVGAGLKKNAIHDILHGGPLWLHPDSALQFLSTDKMANIILDLLDRHIYGEVFNLCGRGVIALREVMELAGRSVPVEPDSPVVRYEVNIEKIMQFALIPETKQCVAEYVGALKC